MKVACLVPYPLDRVPGQRFRLEQWKRPLEQQGIALTFFPLLSSETMDVLYKPGHLLEKARDLVAGCVGRATWALRQARDFDAVVIYREVLLLGIDFIEELLARRVPTLFDFDDAVWLPNVSPANRRLRFLKGFAKIDRILGMVSSVSAGCEYLADHARRFNDNVFVVPTSIDLDLYGAPRAHESTEVLTVGWTGSVSTAEYLRLITDTLARAAKTVPMKLVFLGAANVQVPGVDVRCVPWSSENEIPVIRTFDVGLKPTPREDWTRGKCPMKDIQYMALGIPPVATRFGTTLESIEHGRTGFLCDTDDDWVTALERLQDVELRRQIGKDARVVVEERYSSIVAAKRFACALEAARDRFRKGRRTFAAASLSSRPVEH
jgi:glycosyltransferase involved in cell wall biosynthesis